MVNLKWISNLFYYLISTRKKMFATGFLISAVLSTLIFIFVNYEPYYLTKGIEYEKEAKALCSNIQILADSHASSKDGVIASLLAINKIILKSTPYVEILFNNDIKFDNGKIKSIRPRRTPVIYEYTFSNNMGLFSIKTTTSNKPLLRDHLVRAWTLSIYDLVKNKSSYDYYMKNYFPRSEYLYKTMAIVSIYVFSLLIFLKYKHEEANFLNEQLEKEGYFLIRRRENLLKEKNDIEGGALTDENEQRLSNIDQNIQELNVEIDKITIKSGINVGHAKITFFDAGEKYTAEELKEKLLISEFLMDHRITHIKYSDRYFRKEVHIKTFSDLINGNWLSKEDTDICINVVLVDVGETKQKKKDRMTEILIKSILAVKNLDVNVSTINKQEFLHMRKLELVRDDNKKLDLIFDQGMDFVSPYQNIYIVNADNYVVIQNLQP